MKKITQIFYLFLFAGFMLTNCDSATSPDLNQTEQSAFQQFNKSSDNNSDYITVNDTNLGINWGWVQETGTTGEFEFIDGPGTPVIGTGSAAFYISDSEDGVAFIGSIFEGSTPLSTIENLTYNTYQTTNSDQAVSLQFNINYEGGQDWQGRIVFEPYYEGDIESGLWQSWDVLTQRGWWATGAPGEETCPIDEPCTWDEILDEYPDAVIRAEEEADNTGLIIFKAGSGWDNFEGSVDGFTISVNGDESTYNFEPVADENGDDENNPTLKEDCKNGGWLEYGFRNQGQCIRYVNTGQDSRNGDQDENGDNDENGENGDNDENGDQNENGNGNNGNGNGNGNNGNGNGPNN